jgi:tRNA (guanine37-N1)-methyltransferase
MVESVLGESILGRAARKGLVEFTAVDIRNFTDNRHNRVDDYTYGGGAGMLMQAQPVFDCCKSVQTQVTERQGRPARVLYMSPLGRTFDQRMAQELAKEEELILLCGHYEGIDARALEEIGVEEVSIGDFVLTGGELPALVLADSISRMIPGVLSEEVCFTDESHYSSLLEYPQYTRPPVWHDRAVPEVLLSGHHGNIEKYRREKSLERTLERRPDLLENAQLSKKDIEYIRKLKEDKN